MAIDWGLSTALLGRDDFAQRRADQAYNLQLQQQMAEQAAHDYAQEQAAQQGLLDAFNKPSQLDVLPADKQRIIDFEKQQRAPIEEALYNANGDTDQFYANGGKGLLNTYQQGLLNAKDARGINPIAAGLANKHVNAMYENARDNGLDIAPVLDAQGNEIPFEQQLKEHGAGKRHLLEWNGSAKYEDNLPVLKYLSSEYSPDGNRLAPHQYTVDEIKPLLRGTAWQKARDLKQITDPRNPKLTVVHSKYDAPPKPHVYSLSDIDRHNYFMQHGSYPGTTRSGGGAGTTGVVKKHLQDMVSTINTPGESTLMAGTPLAPYQTKGIPGTATTKAVTSKKIPQEVKKIVVNANGGKIITNTDREIPFTKDNFYTIMKENVFGGGKWTGKQKEAYETTARELGILDDKGGVHWDKASGVSSQSSGNTNTTGNKSFGITWK